MEQKKVLSFALFLVSLIISFGCFSQEEFTKFKHVENRVRYLYPDSLSIFAAKLDTNTTTGKGLYYWSTGRAAYWKSDYPKAYKNIEIASKILKQKVNAEVYAQLLLDLSGPLSVMDYNGKALSFLLEAQKLVEKSKNKEIKAKVGISLGEHYRKTSEFENSFSILFNTLTYAKSKPYTHANCLNRIAAVHSESGSMDSSLYYSFKALKIAESIQDPNLIATSENEIGYILRIQRRLEEALPHFYRADSLWRSAGMLRYAINAMHHISVVYGTINDLDNSIQITRKAYKLIQGKKWYRVELNLLEDLRNLQNQLNRTDSAQYFENKRLEVVVQWKDQQYATNTRMVEILFTQEQNEQTIEQQNKLLEKEREEKEIIRRERRTLTILISVIAILLVVIFIYAYRQRGLKKKLHAENKEKEKKNDQLEEALNSNEALVQEISHRVKNNLAVLSGLLRMQSKRSGNPEVIKELEDSILRIDSISTIHKKLYDKRADARVNIGEAVQDLITNISNAMGLQPDRHLKIKVDYGEVDIAQAVTFCLILNEVITNSCKYGNIDEEKPLYVSLSILNNHIRCEVKDQGPGFENENLEKKSLGLYLINKLSKQLKAEYSWNKTKEFFIFRIDFLMHESIEENSDSGR